jgi:hypothetical protein
MKILKLLILVLAITVGSTSCSKDDDIAKVSGNKYETTYAKISATVDGVEHSTEYKTIADLKENDLYLKVDFRTDNTFWVYDISDIEGKMNPIEEPTYEWIEVGTWTQKDSKISIVTDDEQTFTAEIDGNKLVMIVDISDNPAKKLAVKTTTPSVSIEWHFIKI